MELTKIKGVSDKRKEDFEKLSVLDTYDLIRFFPRNYLDLRIKQLLKYAYHNDVVLTVGRVISSPVVLHFRRGGMVKVTCEQEGLIFQINWFNQPYIASKLKEGEEYLFYGRVRIENGVYSLTNPSFELCEKAFRLKGIVPQYKLKGSLTQKLVRDAVRVGVLIEKPQSIIPFDLQKKYGLSDLYTAFSEVHNPTDFTALKKASDRIAIEEYFALISALKYIKGGKEQVRLNKYTCTDRELVEFIHNRYPFEFTDGQKSAVNEIYADMTGETVMNRLVQGDVGSGKTAVSTCALFMAVKSGYQAVMLAPTEVLARQNFNSVCKVFPDYNVELLTGSMSAKEKKDVKERLKNGFINILVGTHAVIQEDVEFKKLSLCICDEQQRFGVAQRSSLLSKGITPDVLVMSATPIPRTLSLIFYGDLDITTIKDKPASRIPIQTNIVPKEKYLDMLGFIEREIKDGKRAYLVCPRIEGDEEGSIMSVTEIYEEVSKKLPNIKVSLLHGKMKDAEKNNVMQDFKDGKIELLVSTTVIEVGVDVAEATVMVIYNAERFGLSALHQLRGRVGRSDFKSYCFLLTGSKDPEAIERLKILKDNADGFKISEYDYKLRGSGDFIGSRQSGKFLNDLGCLNYDTDSIFLAKKISDEFFESGRDISPIKQIAYRKYQRLKDVSFN